ncbi:MAG: RNA polymerase sigma factor [Deltaproteobacteria bacterium]|nr:RNA polymerase sigma factor [Deltaproteobacteria bacterium]
MELDVAEICRRYGASIVRRCRGMLRNSIEAEDAAQEVFIIVMQKGIQYRGDADIASWLYRITTNHCLNKIRSSKRRILREQSQQVINWSIRPNTDPNKRYYIKDSLQNLLVQLDIIGQQILVYRYLDGLTQEEIANLTNKSRRTIGKHLKKIEQLLEKCEQSKNCE